MQGICQRCCRCLIIGARLRLKAGHFRLFSLSSKAVQSPNSNATNENYHVAIVGGGPAGFYTAQQILKSSQNVQVDIYEKLPVPFGLVRFGVAPDHPEVKNVINTFTQTAQSSNCHFFGNVEIGKTISLKELKEAYSAVVLSYGTAADRTLGIPGENLPNVLSARSFVGWYNGLPEDRQLAVDLDCETAVVLGQGNVALDVARILLSPIDKLKKTDITEYALEALCKSQVKRVHVVGRRGPLQVAFTIKELREMINLPATKTVIDPAALQGLEKLIQDLPRPRRRLTELICQTGIAPTEKLKSQWVQAEQEWSLDFMRSPVRFISTSDDKLQGVEMMINRLEGKDPEHMKAEPTEEKEVLECGMVLRSIGYKGLQLDSSLPFDTSKGVIKTEEWRVKGNPGLYCTGWIATGPVGVILGTMSAAFETGRVVVQDLKAGVLASGREEARNKLLNHLSDTAVSFPEWGKIDAAEIAAGTSLDKPREKFTSVQHMLSVAKS